MKTRIYAAPVVKGLPISVFLYGNDRVVIRPIYIYIQITSWLLRFLNLKYGIYWELWYYRPVFMCNKKNYKIVNFRKVPLEFPLDVQL